MDVSSISAPGAPLADALPTSESVRTEFLNLFITQMRNQNPLEPLSNDQMVTQLAQFSTLEQMEKLNQSMSSLALGQQVSQAAALIGRQVTYSGEAGEVTTTVTGVLIQNGAVKLEAGGVPIELSSIVRIENRVAE